MAAPQSGDPNTTRFDVVAHDRSSDFAAHTRTRIDYGDGDYVGVFSDSSASPPRDGTETSAACGPTVDVLKGPAINGDNRAESVADHTYRRPGQYMARTLVESGSGPQEETVTVDTPILVAPKPVQSQGPVSPFVQGGDMRRSGSGNRTVVWEPNLCDEDGWISSVRVDWRDGSAPTVIDRGLKDCVDPGSRFPSSLVQEHLQHDYTAAGQYYILIQIHSSGCDGGDPQDSSDAVFWQVN